MSVAGTLTASQTYYNNDSGRRYASITSYQSLLLLTYNNSTGYVMTLDPTSGNRASVSWLGNQARGMHYNILTDKIVMVSGSNGELQTFEVTPKTKVTVSTNGEYKTLRGDVSNSYVFGWKVDSDGSTNQLFRVDVDGTNEIVVSTTSLFRSNEQLDGFTLDSDNELVYFHGLTSRTLRSVSWDLTGFTTHNLILQHSNGGSIEYSRGYIYYWGVEQDNPTGINSNFDRYNPSNDEIYQINGISESIRNGVLYTPALFIDPESNRMLVSGESKFRIYVLAQTFSTTKPSCQRLENYSTA